MEGADDARPGVYHEDISPQYGMIPGGLADKLVIVHFRSQDGGGKFGGTRVKSSPGRVERIVPEIEDEHPPDGRDDVDSLVFRRQNGPRLDIIDVVP